MTGFREVARLAEKRRTAARAAMVKLYGDRMQTWPAHATAFLRAALREANEWERASARLLCPPRHRRKR